MAIEKTNVGQQPEPLGLGRWKTAAQNRLDRLATLLSAEPNTTLQATRRTAYVQRLQQAVESRHKWATEMTNHLAAVKDLLEQRTAQGIGATAKGNSSSASKLVRVGELG